MSAQTTFTSSEIASIVKAVMLPVAYLIGNVSGSGPQKLAVELGAANKAMAELAKTQFKGNPVIQSLAAALKDPKVAKGDNVKNMTPDQFAAKLKGALAIVDGKASPADAQGCRTFIYAVTTRVAESYSEGFLGLGAKVSAAERKYLDSLKKLLDTAPASKAQTSAATAVAKAAAAAKTAAAAAAAQARAQAAKAAAVAAAQARAQAAKAAATAAGEVYVVKKGDSLSAIAKQYLGKANLYPQIVEATNDKAKTDSRFAVIKNANLIHVGQKIWIPKK